MKAETFEGHPILGPEKIPLPPRLKISVPNLAVSLVNRSLKAAYPNFYGKEIPVLKDSDILVVSQQGFDQFSDSIINKVFHPITHVYDKKKEQETDKPLEQISSSMITFWDYPGRPILILERYMNEVGQFGNLVAAEVLASMLIHENIHRVPRVFDIPLKPEDPATKTIALSTQMTVSHLLDENPQGESRKRLNELNRNIITRPAMLRMFGALAITYCLNETDRRMRRVADNGYDMNEAIVELLAKSPRKYLMTEIANNHNNDGEGRRVISALEYAQGKDSSVRIQQYPPEMALNFCSDLGLRDETSIFRTYANSRLPVLHTRTKPKMVYPT